MNKRGSIPVVGSDIRPESGLVVAVAARRLASVAEITVVRATVALEMVANNDVAQRFY